MSSRRSTPSFLRLLRPAVSRGLSSLLIVILALAASQLSSPVLAQVGKPDVLYYKSWAIVIAIEDYRFAPKLTGTIADGQMVAGVLAHLGFDDIIELYDEKASYRQMRYIFEDFLPRKVGRMDRVVVFFAGHSGVAKNAEGGEVGYLVPQDIPLGNVKKSLTVDQLKDYFRRIMSKHVLLFLDTGISGWKVNPPSQLSLEGRMAPEDETEKRAFQLLTAARASETLIRKNGKGIFVESLVEGMMGASDSDENGWILASELGAFVSQRVTAVSEGAQQPQFVRLDGDGDMVLREGKPGPLGGYGELKTDEDKRAAAEVMYYQALADLQSEEPPEKVLELLDQSLLYDPTYAEAHILKAYVLLQFTPHTDAALESALQGVEYAPDNPDSHLTLGLVLQRIGDYPQAELAFRNTLVLNPTYTDLYLILGDLYADKIGDEAKAVDAYQRYVELGGTSNRAREYVAARQPASKPKP